MAHECKECGRTFETLTRLRLHACDQSTDSLDPSTATDPPTFSPSDSTNEADEKTPKPHLQRVFAGETEAIYSSLATFEAELESRLTNQGGEAYRDLFWDYYKPLSNALDGATRDEGWALLKEITEAYAPAQDDHLPLATPVIANAVGRHVIRARLETDVTAIPLPALVYLDSVVINAGETTDVSLEEVHTLGWAIDHPDFSLLARLKRLAQTDIYTINPILEHAFYADQEAAVGVLEELLRDDAIGGGVPEPFGEEMSHRRYLLDCVYGPATEDHRPTAPRYWDWCEEYDFAFEFKNPVERRLRDLVRKYGFDKGLPTDWSLQDLAI